MLQNMSLKGFWEAHFWDLYNCTYKYVDDSFLPIPKPFQYNSIRSDSEFNKQGFEYSSHLWKEIIRKISLYVVLNKAFSIASKNTKFTINVVPVTAKSADRTLLDFDVFGESEQTGAMTSKSDDHSLAWRNKNQIVSSLHLNPGVRCRRQH